MCLGWPQSSALCIRRRESLNFTTGDLSILASLQASLNLTSSPKAAWHPETWQIDAGSDDAHTTRRSREHKGHARASRQKYHRRVSQGNLSSLSGDNAPASKKVHNRDLSLAKQSRLDPNMSCGSTTFPRLLDLDHTLDNGVTHGPCLQLLILGNQHLAAISASNETVHHHAFRQWNSSKDRLTACRNGHVWIASLRS